MEERIPRVRIVGAVISLVLSTVVLLALLFVVPRFKDVFEAVDVPLPGMLVLLIGLSDGVRSWWPVVALAAAVEGVALIWSLRHGTLWLRIRTWVLIVVVPLMVLALFLPLQSLLQGIGRQK